MTQDNDINKIENIVDSFDNAMKKGFISGLILFVLEKETGYGYKIAEEINKYINLKLRKDLLSFDEESRKNWEKLFGNVTIRLVDIAQSVAIGGGAGGGAAALLGNAIPNASTWEIILLGALGGAVKSSPKLVQTLLDFIMEHRRLNKSSIAYIGKFR